jgi:opacity protein-like surface antigen
MMKPLLALAVFTAATLSIPAHAQQWSLGAGAGPFIFGNFVERTFRVSNGGSSSTTKTSLSAKTRAGATLDLERQLNDTFSIRFRGTFVDSPLAVDGGASGGGVALDAGKVDVTTLSVPFVFQLSRRGAIRFHVMGGPAYAMYKIRRQGTTGSGLGIYAGSRNRFGAMAGAGVDWWLSDRFALEAEGVDIVTSSPFERSDYPSGTVGLHIKRPNNIHTSGGIRYRF